MKKLISFALWGSDPKYTTGALKNAYAAPAHYPDWICRYYCASDADPSVVNELKSLDHVEVVEVPTPGDWKFSINRFLLSVPLIITYLIGPIGLFLYWIIRIFYAKKIIVHE